MLQHHLSPRVVTLIKAGKYTGSRGAIRQARDEHPTDAKYLGNVSDCWALANVYYSAASFFYSLPGLWSKLQSLYFLFTARRFAILALQEDTKETRKKQDTSTTLLIILRQMMSINNKTLPLPKSTHGDVHIYMSIITHIARVKRLLRMNVRDDFDQARECRMIIASEGGTPSLMLRTLAEVTLLHWPELNPTERRQIIKDARRFMEKNQHLEDQRSLQTLIRIARAIGDHETEQRLALQLGSNDQKMKAHVPPLQPIDKYAPYNSRSFRR